VEPVLLRIQEAATLLNVSKWTIYRWIEEGRLRATKLGQGSLRVFRASVIGLAGGVEPQIPRTRTSPRKMTRRGKGLGRKKNR
jgi:excisionase family DNA binding protein